MKLHSIRLLGAIGVTALCVAACASSDPVVTPADTPAKVGPTAAEVGTPEVLVTVRSEAWSGFPEDLGERVTPLNVRIENRSAEPIYFGYSHVMLVEQDGKVRHALPPFEIDGEVIVKREIQPTFDNHDFLVATPYEPLYPGMGGASYVPAPGVTYDYAEQYRHWGVELPTVQMVAAALPEGVINPGGSISGFVYFEHVDDDAGSLTFAYQARSTRENTEIADVTVVFDVDHRS